MDQFHRLKQLSIIPTSSYSGYLINNWPLNGDLTNSIVGGSSLSSSGFIGFDSLYQPPSGNTLWVSGTFGPNSYLFYTLPQDFSTAGQISMQLNVSSAIGRQQLFLLSSSSLRLYGLITETQSGISFDYRGNNNTPFNVVTSGIPRDQTFKLTINWDNTVPCITMFVNNTGLIFSGNQSLYMTNTSNRQIIFGSELTTDALLPQSRIGQIYFSGTSPVNTPYITGLLSGYSLNIYSGPSLLPQYITTFGTNVGYFSGTPPVGMYTVVYNGYTAAKQLYISGLGTNNSLIIV